MFFASGPVERSPEPDGCTRASSLRSIDVLARSDKPVFFFCCFVMIASFVSSTQQVYLEGSATGVSVTADEQANYSIFLATEV